MRLSPWWLLIPVLGALNAWWWSPSSIDHAPGVLVAEVPQQQVIQTATAFVHRGYHLTPLANFSLRARVLARRDYHHDREAQISPVDLALGWGPMSDSSVLDEIRIEQRGRFYYWRVQQFPVPRQHIERNSANMHLIPANAEVEAAIRRSQSGSLIALSGQLVRVSADDGFTWTSSLTRNDTGAGACEVIYVTEFFVESLPAG